MCKHILNQQVQIFAKCCRKWFDCPQCHAESENHEIEKQLELILACKKCKKVFRIDPFNFDPDSDGYCPHCDNHWYIQAETPEDRAKMTLQLEAIDGVDETELIRDTRDPAKERRRQRMLEERVYNGTDDMELLELSDEVAPTGQVGQGTSA